MIHAGDVIDLGEGEGGDLGAEAGALLALLQGDLEALTVGNVLDGAAQVSGFAVGPGGDLAMRGIQLVVPSEWTISMSIIVGRSVGEDAIEQGLVTRRGWRGFRERESGRC